MVFTAVLLLCLLEAVTSNLSTEQRNEYLTAHNELRKNPGGPGVTATNMRKLEWSTMLEQQAQATADTCHFQHTSWQARDLTSKGLGNVGEHIYAWPGEPTAGEITKRVQGWYDEIKDFSYPRTCHGVCGHYVGVVWAASCLIGCGLKYCPSGVASGTSGHAGTYYVCLYFPLGVLNPRYVKNEFVYVRGSPCQDCPSGTRCEDGLCAGGTCGEGGGESQSSQQAPQARPQQSSGASNRKSRPSSGSSQQSWGGSSSRGNSGCKDTKPWCASWKAHNSAICKDNKSMPRVCKKTCNFCSGGGSSSGSSVSNYGSRNSRRRRYNYNSGGGNKLYNNHDNVKREWRKWRKRYDFKYQGPSHKRIKPD